MIFLYQELAYPDVIREALKSCAMERIGHVDMNCGMNYTSFPLFQNMNPYTRLEHSIGTALLVHHFTLDPVQTLAGLFHDIATPVFSHVVDFMAGDHMVQESTEARTALMIQEDPVICRLLKRQQISIDAVADYHRYPIADNDSPKLSCDRLEYTLGNMVNYGFEQPAAAAACIRDLVVADNEQGEKELQFQTEETALWFARTALKCGRIYSGRENRFAMETLARILKQAVKTGILKHDDLYGREEKVIARLKESPLQEAWKSFCGLYQIEEGSEGDGLNLDAKRRYIDPLIQGKGRVSEYSDAFRKQAEEFVQESYDVWLKGISYYEENRNCQHE